MAWNSRFFTEPKLEEIVSCTDEISNHCQEIADALADYQGAKDLPKGEQAEAREAARESASQALGELLTETAKLEPYRKHVLEME